MSEGLFVLAVGAFAGTVYCAGHSIMLWWYRRRARKRFEQQVVVPFKARPWWVDKEDRF